MKYTFIVGKKTSHSQTIPVEPVVLQVVECIVTAPSSCEFMSLPLALTHCARPLCMVMDYTPAATRTAGTSAHHAGHPENSALSVPVRPISGPRRHLTKPQPRLEVTLPAEIQPIRLGKMLNDFSFSLSFSNRDFKKTTSCIVYAKCDCVLSLTEMTNLSKISMFLKLLPLVTD